MIEGIRADAVIGVRVVWLKMAAVYLPELLLYLLHSYEEHAFEEFVETLIVCFI